MRRACGACASISCAGAPPASKISTGSRAASTISSAGTELYADASDLEPIYSTLAALPATSIAHLGLSKAGLPTLLKLAEKGMKVKATGFGRVIDIDVPSALRDLAKANPDGLMFGSDLPSQRARRPFLPSDVDLIRESLDPALWDKVFYENAIAFYRPRKSGNKP